MPEKVSGVKGYTMALCPSPRPALSSVAPMCLLVATAASEAYSACGRKFQKSVLLKEASQAARVGKKPPADAGDVKDPGSIPRSGRSLEEGMVTHSSILAWRIPRTEEPGRRPSIWFQ